MNELKKETVSNVEAILLKDTKNEISSDNFIKFQLKMIFIDETIPNTIKYPDLEDSQCLLLSKLVAFISILLEKNYTSKVFIKLMMKKLRKLLMNYNY